MAKPMTPEEVSNWEEWLQTPGRRWHSWHDDVSRFVATVRERDAEIERLQKPISDTYACGFCGRRDGLDCVVPNQIWNQIEAETSYGVLCTWCLDRECKKRGISVRAILAFSGKAIWAGTDPLNNDTHWERHLGDLTERCSQAEAERDRLRKALQEIDDHPPWGGDDITAYIKWLRGLARAALRES